MMRKPILLLSAFFLLNVCFSLIYSCTKLEDDDIWGGGSFNSHKCVVLENLYVDLFNGSHGGIKVEEGAEIKHSDFYVNMAMNGEEVQCASTKKLQNPFFTSAYALTPPPPTITLKDSIVGISITSSNDFDSVYTAGKNLISLFDTVEFQQKDLGIVYGQYSGKSRFGYHSYKLRHFPKKDGSHIFMVKYTLQSGKEVEGRSHWVFIHRR